jgi:hypothetical protein
VTACYVGKSPEGLRQLGGETRTKAAANRWVIAVVRGRLAAGAGSEHAPTIVSDPLLALVDPAVTTVMLKALRGRPSEIPRRPAGRGLPGRGPRLPGIMGSSPRSTSGQPVPRYPHGWESPLAVGSG